MWCQTFFFSSHQNTNEDRFSKYGGALGAHGIEEGPRASFSCFNLDRASD